jgi:hypothetical protein
MSFQLALLLKFLREVFYIAPPLLLNLQEGPQITSENGQYLIPGTLPVTTARNHWVLSGGMVRDVGDIFLDRLLSTIKEVSLDHQPCGGSEDGSELPKGESGYYWRKCTFFINRTITPFFGCKIVDKSVRICYN